MLYIRDALQLNLESASDVPPPLIPPVPESAIKYESLPSDSDRWLKWWYEVVAVHATLAGLRPDEDSVSARRHLYKRLQEMGEAPQFAGLCDAPELQRAAIELVRTAALAWSHRLDDDSAWSRDFGGIVSLDRFEEVAGEDHLTATADISDISLVLHVLHVEGMWWHAASPNLLLLSFEAATNPDCSRRAIRAALSKQP